MKEYYRIGETASLMGITTQTLRFYDKIGLVKPIKIDPRTGYRYYAYEQFHFIDRIKYLQSLGIPLDDIKEVMLSKKVLEEEEKKIRHQIEMVDWYKDYFTYMERNEDAPNILKLPEGDYLCFRERILEEAWNPQRIISYFQGKAKPELMLAMEYEDNLDNYAHANYEIQILLEKN